MDAQPPTSDDMNELEKRLSGWQPSAAGLDADAVLFAAGRASVRPPRSRLVWPAVAGCLALLAVALGVALAQERGTRIELAARLQNQRPHVMPVPPSESQPDEIPVEEPPAAASYLASRRALTQGLDAWVAKAAPADGPLAPGRPILKAGSRDDLFVP